MLNQLIKTFLLFCLFGFLSWPSSEGLYQASQNLAAGQSSSCGQKQFSGLSNFEDLFLKTEAEITEHLSGGFTPISSLVHLLSAAIIKTNQSEDYPNDPPFIQDRLVSYLALLALSPPLS